MGHGNFEIPNIHPAQEALSRGARWIVYSLYIIAVILLIWLVPQGIKEKTETEDQPGELFDNAPTEQTT
tara:strand:- start:119 stop:325 length:207 start_codon:yes stop_codon:yes gene_type:complete